MAYTDIDKPSDYFETKLYTGNGGTQSITGLDFAPNWVWIKKRELKNHQLYDSVRGATEALESDSTSAETTRTTELTSFNSDGFSLGSGAKTNESSGTYVSWNWKAGTSFTNDASATGIGSIDSAGSVNNDAGFSIVSYTGTGSNGTIKHGLNSALSIIIVKGRDFVDNWMMFHSSLGGGKKLKFNLTGAEITSSEAWNNTSPTSSVFSVGIDGEGNNNGSAMIAYCFAEKKGYSKFGSYTGNGNADGTFIYTGFKPAFCMVHRSSAAGENWLILDNKRDSFNPQDSSIYPNLSNAEDADGADYFDFVSNGMKVRTTNGGTNTSGATYIYMAFAENPFVTSTGVPATAR